MNKKQRLEEIVKKWCVSKLIDLSDEKIGLLVDQIIKNGTLSR